MAEREHLFTEIENELKNREKAIARIAKRGGVNAGPGEVMHCTFCSKRYRVMGNPNWPGACPYCGR